MRDQVQHGKGAENHAGLAAYLLAWFQTPWRERFRRLGKARAERRMEFIEVLQLGGKRQLMLVACAGRQYLVGAGSDSVQSIVEIGEERSAGDKTTSAEPVPRTGLHWNGFYVATQPSEPELGSRH